MGYNLLFSLLSYSFCLFVCSCYLQDTGNNILPFLSTAASLSTAVSRDVYCSINGCVSYSYEFKNVILQSRWHASGRYNSWVDI